MKEIHSIDAFICSATASLRDVLGRINSASYLFQIVLDPQGRPIGTVTDGDIRRAILAGADMTTAVTAAMSRHPILGRRDDSMGNRQKMANLGMKAAFLPVTDDNGVLVGILVQNGEIQRVRTALVMAGGYGRRLGAKTLNTPKPLLQVGGVPILERVLASLENAGVEQIHIAVHYLAEQIQSFVRQRSNRAEIGFVHETTPLGTIGAIGLLPPQATSESMFVVNGDIVTQLDISAFGGFHFKHGYDATIAVQKYDVAIPYGVIRHDSSGQFSGIDEKPTVSHFVSAGVYVISPETAALVENDRATDMPELLSTGKSIGLRIGLFPIHEYWKDIGRPEDLETADQDHTENSEVP
jgi:dTDP-glucose pyrophosphorylase